MSIFADEKKPILYIVPDCICESVEIQRFAADQQPLSVNVIPDENENIYRIEITKELK